MRINKTAATYHQPAPFMNISPLDLAAAAGHIKIVAHILDECGPLKGAVALEAHSPLHSAAKEGHLPIVVLLCENGYLVDIALRVHNNSAMFRPLELAAQHARLNVVRFLLEQHYALLKIEPENHPLDLERKPLLNWRKPSSLSLKTLELQILPLQ